MIQKELETREVIKQGFGVVFMNSGIISYYVKGLNNQKRLRIRNALKIWKANVLINVLIYIYIYMGKASGGLRWLVITYYTRTKM